MYENPLFAERVMKFGKKGWESGQKGWKSSKHKSTTSSVGEEDDYNIIDFTEDEEKQFDI